MSEIVSKKLKKDEANGLREEYCKFLFDGEEKIESFFNRVLHESIKLYGNIAPKIKKEDGIIYGIDDLWVLINNLNEIIS